MGCNGWEGDWCRTRDLRGRAYDDLFALIVTLSEVALSYDRPDSWRWGLDNNGVLFVKRISSLVDKVLHDGITVASHKWVSLLPKMINFFMWRLSLDRLPTRTKLVDIGVGIISEFDSVLCLMCGEVPKDIDHIFSLSRFIILVWKKILDWWRINYPVSNGVVNALRSANFLTGDPKVNKAFFAIRLVMLWCIWKWRNKVVRARSKYRSSIINSDIVKEVQVLSHL
ncbi:RNA-directed DNA polymerase, eukaryota, reverse transcriptase zinc-binding domain protein [Tanacetum coccineum]